MSRARNLADLLNASGKIKSSKLDGETVGNDTLDSQHYAAGSIDLEHLSSESVDEDNLHISNAGTNGQYLQKQSGNAGGLTWGTVDLTTLSATNLTSGIVPTARINAGSIANDLLDSQHYAAGSIDTEHLAADSVTTAKIADSVALGGSPTTTTQSAADNSTKVATTAYADAAVAALADSAPSTLNTLNELAAALGDDANYAATTTTAIGTKMPLAGGAFTGAVTTNSTFDGRDVATDGTKLDGIEANATADQTAAQIKTHLENGIDSVHYVDGSIDNEHIADNAINSEHYADGSIDRAHLAADIIDGTKIADDAINSEHYAAGSIDNEHISGMAASKLTGALPAISGASLTNLPAGGVTSLNGQTGSITNTAYKAIGSYTLGRPNSNTDWAVNTTISGGSLYATSGETYWNGSSWAGGGLARYSHVNTGTWRCVSPAPFQQNYGARPGLWVRIS